MEKLTIKEVDNNIYRLEDSDNKKYKIILEFQNIEELPTIGDTIYISEELLNKNYEEYSTFYTFGPLDSIYGRSIDDEKNPDLIRVDINNKSIYLKRLYG